MSSYEEIAEFCETHSLSDYWEQTEPADFEIDPHAHRRYLVTLDPELLQRVQKLARSRGLSTESLVNLHRRRVLSLYGQLQEMQLPELYLPKA